MLMRVVYRLIVLPFAFLFFHIAAIFSKNLRQGLLGRYRALREIKQVNSKKPVIMIHAASLGEFEHVRPIIHYLGEKFLIVVTFFSPSGYNHAKKTFADEIHIYLPFDFLALWKWIFKKLSPRLLIVSKHDIWPNQILCAKKRGVPSFLVNASLAKTSTRLNWFYRNLTKEIYKSFTHIYAISNEDEKRFRDYFALNNISVIGDTKFDQALIRKEAAQKKELINPAWPKDSFVLVLGSVWPEDFSKARKALKHTLEKNKNFKLILVPHQLHEDFLTKLAKEFQAFGVHFYSKGKTISEARVLIVDVVGILADIYQYAHAAYIGGSVKQGIHNVMEAAVYNIPVMFGPKYENNFEASQLVQEKIAIVVRGPREWENALERLIGDEDYRKKLGQQVGTFALKKTGTTQRLLKEWEPLLK